MSNVTSYQIALMLGESIILSLGYSERHTKGALFRAMCAAGPEIIKAAKWDSDEGEFVWSGAEKAWVLPTGHCVRFTGATAKCKI